jgi:hypothetical protein
MGARLRSWWQKLSKPMIVVAITIGIVGVLALVIFGYRLRLAWTGFFNRTLWDWLQLLIVPLVLAIIAFMFQVVETVAQQKIALNWAVRELPNRNAHESICLIKELTSYT